MPNYRSKTSFMRSNTQRAIPPICISKPGTTNCQLTKFDCDNHLTGFMQFEVADVDACRAIAAEQGNCIINMNFWESYPRGHYQEQFNNCGGPPPTHGFWNTGTTTETGQDANFIFTAGYLTGAINIFSDEYGFLLWAPAGAKYRFSTWIITGDQITQIYLTGDEFPATEYPGWIGGTWENAPEPPP